MKKIFKGLSIILALTLVFSAGVFASGTLETISAYLNHGITIEYNDVDQTMVDANGQRVIPITYNGTTYLPVRAVSNMLGVKVDWDQATQTVLLGNSYPDVVAPTTPPTPQTPAIEPTQDTAPSGNITSEQLDFSFLYNAVQNAGKVKLDPSAVGYLKDGKWLGTAYEVSGDYAYAFPTLGFISTKGSGAVIDNFADFEKSITDCLTTNGYTFAGTDSFGVKYYTKGTTEVKLWNVNGSNTRLNVEVSTKWLTKYIEY